jgi:hypothetical protein
MDLKKVNILPMAVRHLMNTLSGSIGLAKVMAHTDSPWPQNRAIRAAVQPQQSCC